ncbi:hypothetical protein [Phenylobacterium sp.]|uniref:hypothetical protein n=1 Tax=Phenylobacterium sp. TaxID=1871053 RepID=UPI0011FF88B2|nr:hypothetical protein [Phenylobacterium sp.]THD64403.1 MAG: hypothetical protein E8A49_02685 [Phenylobacterium sp.]
MRIAEIFASSSFLFFYSGLLVLLTGVAILRNHMSLIAEAKVTREIIGIVDAAHARDPSGKVEQLVLLNDSTGARILTNDACRSDDLGERKVWRNPKSATARATASYLGAMAALPAERHSLEGLRPARTMIEDEYRRLHRGLSGFGDFIIRLSLLGTFMGLIAALSIASANIGAAQGSADVQSAHMRDFIQVLLATAANKFWISAVGVGCALVVQIYRASVERAAHIARLGDAFDHALTDPEIAAAWCPPMAADGDVDLRFVKAAVLDRISKLDLEPLNEALAETAAAIKANAGRSVITFGPELSRRSGE